MKSPYNNQKDYKSSQQELNSFGTKPSSLSTCLNHLKKDWKKNKSIASLWKDWPKIAGSQLSSHCIPLTFNRGTLTIGANHPHWIQALIFNRNQLLAALKAEGHEIKNIRIKQYFPENKPLNKEEKDIWEKHPSRSDIHGKQPCPICNSPSPNGEISLWGKCGFCRREELAK